MFQRTSLGFAAFIVLGLTFGAAAQMVVGGAGGPSGGFVLAEGGSSSLYPLVFQLRDDNQWAAARTALVEKATDGRAVEVVYTLQKTRKQQKDEKVSGRIDAVLGDLEEAGLYPIATSEVKKELTELKAALKKLRASKVKSDAVPAFLMAIRGAEKQIAKAHVILETGEEPAPKGRRMMGGQIIRGSRSGE
ncbi:MAG: hypothetical protein AAF581_18585 [Planctomycetota bacterium]